MRPLSNTTHNLDNPMNKTLRLSLSGAAVLSVLALGACGTQPMAASAMALVANLAAANEVPAVNGAATGQLEATLTPGTHVLTWRVTYSGLSGAVTGAHFHGPAMAGQNAGVVVPMSGALASPITGTATLTASQAADLRSGKWYVNLHTAANPNGETRGQVGMRP